MDQKVTMPVGGHPALCRVLAADQPTVPKFATPDQPTARAPDSARGKPSIPGMMQVSSTATLFLIGEESAACLIDSFQVELI